jgi:dUTP pyrophosphatase
VDRIELRDLTFYGYHGVLPEEQRLGQRFLLDITLGLDASRAGQTDELTQTVNYADVAKLARAVVEGPPCQLIETVGERIAEGLLNEFEVIDEASVRVRKPSAPISSVPTASVSVVIERRRDRRRDQAADSGAVLSAPSIRQLLQADPPLVSPLDDPAQQIQPNGVDLTLESVWRIGGAGTLGRTNAERVIPDRLLIEPSPDGWYDLAPGTYIIRLAETVALPLDVMAFGRPRSSLLRSGAALHTAVWDAGYQGRSESLLVVYGVEGIRLARGARVLQLVFQRLDRTSHAYSGTYQGENIPS